MKTLLHEIQIGGHTIPVYKVEDLGNVAEAAGMFRRAGGGFEILIDSSLGPAQAADVYFHEIIEAINMLFELEMDHYQIQCLGVGLQQATSLGLDLSQGILTEEGDPLVEEDDGLN